jgi:hypothetical protein
MENKRPFLVWDDKTKKFRRTTLFEKTLGLIFLAFIVFLFITWINKEYTPGEHTGYTFPFFR